MCVKCGCTPSTALVGAKQTLKPFKQFDHIEVKEDVFLPDGDGYALTIVDPSSPEVNRGSYCYDPYLMAALHNAPLLEEWTVEKMEETEIHYEKRDWVIGLWSYPQIEFARWAAYNLRGKVSFIGYGPLIKRLGFEHRSFDLKQAMAVYPMSFPRFKNIMLSDCDMHIKTDDTRIVYPLFLGYGCVYNCTFCSTVANHGRKITLVDIEDAKRNIEHLSSMGNIHFNDELFFGKPNWYKDELYNTVMKDGAFKWIALTTSNGLRKEIDRVGAQFLIDRGFALAEVGFETDDPYVREGMNKGAVLKDSSDLEVIIDSGITTLWLTVTFFPGETLHSITEAGRFLKKHGFKIEQLQRRVTTNSTHGGLGQFFQPYSGTPVDINGQGVMLNERPVRLTPSFLPYSFLYEVPEVISDDMLKGDYWDFWVDLYNLPDYGVDFIDGQKNIAELIADDPVRKSMYFGLLARMEAIYSVGKKETPIDFHHFRWEYDYNPSPKVWPGKKFPFEPSDSAIYPLEHQFEVLNRG